MNSKNTRKMFTLCLLFSLALSVPPLDPATMANPADEPSTLDIVHGISSHRILASIEELCMEKYAGRLSGTAGYDMAAEWIVSRLQEYGLQPAGDNGTFFQWFDNPYTLVLPGASLSLHLPCGRQGKVLKHYRFEKDFLPGSTSASGVVTGEVVYVGYGITAPELNYDDYRGLNVNGKIVLMEREVPVSPEQHPDQFPSWRSYSYHQYKVKNAYEHGAAGMLYIYHIANPNCQYIADFYLTYVGPSVVQDLFQGTGRKHGDIVKRLQKDRRPQSFHTGKTVTLKNVTEHHPEGRTANVMARIPATTSGEATTVILGAHLDHVGKNHLTMPGANDNASGVAVILEVARALASIASPLTHDVLFIFFAAEEQGVRGSEYFLAQPPIPHNRIVGLINLDGVGRGTYLEVLAGKKGVLWDTLEKANRRFVHRKLVFTPFHNLGRPRLDAAHFMWAGIPTLSLFADGGPPLPYPVYHKTTDTPDILTPEIMEDLAQMLFLAILRLGDT